MEWISDNAIRRLQQAVDLPDLSGTRYTIRETLGRGGMGVVYLADDAELHRQVALKVLHGPVPDADATRRMLREARIIARLEHPGIVPIHDAGTLPDGRPYYVMKLVRGRRLDESHYGDAAGLTERLRLFQRICETVAFAHAHGVVHRDLKPQNVMVGAFGEVLVLDWGVAKMLNAASEPRASARAESEPRASARADAPAEHDAPDGDAARIQHPGAPPIGSDEDTTDTRRTLRGTVIGTPAYMAPEQAHGEVDAVDQRSDVYALGAILYYLLTDQPPKRSAAPANVHAVTTAGIMPPRALNPATPKPLQAICLKAMHAGPARRYTGADELAADVVRFVSGQRVRAHREGVFERIGRVLWKYRTAVLLVLAYLVMRILLIFFGSPR